MDNVTGCKKEESRCKLSSPIHSQVRKIKQEIEKLKHPALEELETMVVHGKITRQRSRSPLGMLSKRPISVS